MFEGTAQEIIELMEYLTTNPAFVIQTAITAALSLGVFVMVGVIFGRYLGKLPGNLKMIRF